MFLKSKFQGCLLGALIGDCVGAHFEGISFVGISAVIDYIQKVKANKKSILQYTDDSCMTIGLADCLAKSKAIDLVSIAERYTEDYISYNYRGYGANIGAVFKELKSTDYKDVHRPSKEQFGGTGSYGNGGAMRIAPLALWGFQCNAAELKEKAYETTLITHSHPLGLEGAWLQCSAIHYLLQNHEKCSPPLDWKSMMDYLDTVISHPEYQNILSNVRKLLESSEWHISEVVNTLGNGIAAQRSVATALFCFLRCQQPIEGIQGEDVFNRTLIYSISLGGDTDTIASMACALAGAQVGYESLPKSLITVCEENDNMLRLADQLAELHNM